MRQSGPHDNASTGDAFASVYAAHRRRIHAFLRRAGCPSRLLEDLTEDVFLRAWARRGDYNGRAAFPTWLLGIARNVALESRRNGHACERLDEEVLASAEDAVVGSAARHERALAVRDAVRKLPPKQQQAIRLVYFDGLDSTQAAVAAGCSRKVLHKRMTDARATLRRLLGADAVPMTQSRG